MTKQNGPTKERELILDILLEILEYGGYSHVVLKKALDKHQYLEKQNRAFITGVAEGTLEYLLLKPKPLNSCNNTFKDSGIPGCGIGSPFTIAS